MTNTSKKITVTLTPETGLEQALKIAGIEPTSVEKLTISGYMHEDDLEYIVYNMADALLELDMSYVSTYKRGNAIALNQRAFNSNLKSITLSAAFAESRQTYLDYFVDCLGLTNITVCPDNPAHTSEDGVLYNKEKTELIC